RCAGIQGVSTAGAHSQGGGARPGCNRDGRGGKKLPAGVRGEWPSGEFRRRAVGGGGGGALVDRRTGQQHHNQGGGTRWTKGHRNPSAPGIAVGRRTGEKRARG